MTKVELIVNNPHYPDGMIIDVEEDVVEDLLKTGHYKRTINKPKKEIEPKKHGKPNFSKKRF